MVRISTRTRHTIAAAKRSAKNAKAVAGEAIGAALAEGHATLKRSTRQCSALSRKLRGRPLIGAARDALHGRAKFYRYRGIPSSSGTSAPLPG
jgi:hypothetical protein